MHKTATRCHFLLHHNVAQGRAQKESQRPPIRPATIYQSVDPGAIATRVATRVAICKALCEAQGPDDPVQELSRLLAWFLLLWALTHRFASVLIR